MKKIITLLLFASLVMSLCAGTMLTAGAEKLETIDMTDLFRADSFTSSKGTQLNYRIYIPENYDESKSYPMILFLHGADQRGNDNVSQIKVGISEAFKDTSSPIYDCIVVAPQCPADDKWVNVKAWTFVDYEATSIRESDSLAAVVELIAKLQSKYSIDKNRLYATGLSMGGYGTWDLLVRHPKLFAAAMPLCGGADYRQASRIKNIPIWTFHGEKDEIVPCIGTEKMVAELEKLGGNCKYTPIPDAGHAIWPEVYAREDVIPWLLSHSKSSGTPVDETVVEPEETETTTETNTTDTKSDNANFLSRLGCKGSFSATLPSLTLLMAGVAAICKKKKH